MLNHIYQIINSSIDIVRITVGQQEHADMTSFICFVCTILPFATYNDKIGDFLLNFIIRANIAYRTSTLKCIKHSALSNVEKKQKRHHLKIKFLVILHDCLKDLKIYTRTKYLCMLIGCYIFAGSEMYFSVVKMIGFANIILITPLLFLFYYSYCLFKKAKSDIKDLCDDLHTFCRVYPENGELTTELDKDAIQKIKILIANAAENNGEYEEEDDDAVD